MKTSKWKPVLAGARQGFTLLEILIAMAIFSIGILAVGTMILTTTRNTTDSNIITQATMLARSKIEEKKREADAGTLSVGVETESNINNNGNAGGIFTRVCNVSSIPVGSSRQIQVTVSWTRNGRNRSVVLKTLNKGS
jgi:prepilin-type N-terminal cleavage/methylation domain-containing protein